ncbi:MAG: ABC transporter permease [Bryobacteraceae bacterium]|jgi:predicted permease
MPEWKELVRRQLVELRLRPEREAEIAEELAQHAEDRYKELKLSGVSDVEALRLTLNEVLDQKALARGLRDVERADVPEPVVLGAGAQGHFLSGLGQDLRYGIRTMRKNAGFSAIAILALAIGIGANTAIFSVVNGVLLQPLAYPDSARLVNIYEASPDFGNTSVAYPNYLDWRRENHSFSDMGAYRSDDFNFTGSGLPEQVSGEYVTASLFPALGVTPLLGRSFRQEEDRQGTGCTVMLSYSFWQGRFGGGRDVLGKTLTLNALSCAVIGVLPANFQLSQTVQVYLPIEQWTAAELRTRESHPGLSVVGRLRPAVTIQSALGEMEAIAKALAQQYPATNAVNSAAVVPMKDDMVGNVRPFLLLLVGAVGFVLIIACANVANLLLARSTARKREFAIRAALGAERWRVVRQLLAESVLLSLCGAAVGLPFAQWGTTLLVAAAPAGLPRSGEVGIDRFVLLFTLAVSLATGILFGLAPALHSTKTNPQESLKQGTRGAGGGRHRAEGIFVTLETCLAVILLAGSALMIQSVWRLLQVNPGFTASHILTMQVAVSPKVMASPLGIRTALRQLVQRVEMLPGAQAAALTSLLPLGVSDSEIDFWLGNGPRPGPEQIKTSVFYVVSPGYHAVMQIPLLRGRFLTDRDNLRSTPVALIDDVMARQIFSGVDPIGRQISLTALGTVQIVGIVGHVKQWGLDSDDANKIRNQVYFPLLQVPDKFMSSGVAGLTLTLRSKGEPLNFVPSVRAAVAGPTDDQPVYAVRAMKDVISGSLAARRFMMLVLIVFASVALLLAAVGIYGVMSYAVTRRTNELGVRSALGASHWQIVGLVLRQGMGLAGAGLIVGLAASVMLTRFMGSLLYGVGAGDPLTLVAVTVVLGVVAMLACVLPAKRASAVDPVVALRCE